MITNINWYPGHMKKTRELIQENLKLVDLVIEVIDGRIPVSSRNPIINQLIATKPRVIVFNKSDLSDKKENHIWIEHFRSQGYYALEMDSNKGQGLKELYNILTKVEMEKNKDKVIKKPLRMMIVGVPNVGKSSLINKMTKRKAAKIGDKPGVTKGKQWLTTEKGMQLLDTPGILWPKFEDPKVGLNLAFCGSIKDEILDISELALELIKVLQVKYPELLIERYKLDGLSDEGDALENFENIALKRGFILPGKRIDYERTGKTILDEFRAAKIGRITLERQADID